MIRYDGLALDLILSGGLDTIKNGLYLGTELCGITRQCSIDVGDTNLPAREHDVEAWIFILGIVNSS